MNIKQKAFLVIKMQQILNRLHAVDSIAKSIEKFSSDSYDTYKDVTIGDMRELVVDLHTATGRLEILIKVVDEEVHEMTLNELKKLSNDDPIL